MKMVKLLVFGTQWGLQRFFKDEIKTCDASAMYSFPSSSVTRDVLNVILSSPNMIIESLVYTKKKKLVL